MMGMSLADIRDASWWEYQALLWNWNDRHHSDAEEEADAPDPEFVARQFAMIERRGLAKVVH